MSYHKLKVIRWKNHSVRGSWIVEKSFRGRSRNL